MCCLIIVVFLTYLSNMKGRVDGVHGLKGMDMDVYSICLTRTVGNVGVNCILFCSRVNF